MNISFLPPILILFFLLIICSTYSAALNANFTACNQNITCGGQSGISYPFYDGTTRPDYCGYPGFKIQCIDNKQIQLNISDQTYRLLGINSTSNTLTVARNDTLVDAGCPSTATNTSIDFQRFDFTSADENITYFYMCNTEPTATSMELLTGQCDLNGYGVLPGYFFTPDMLTAYGLGIWGICQRNLYLPVLKEAAEEIQGSMNVVTTALQSGFQLDWFAENSRCAGCVKSGGLCGSDSEISVCHCTDKDYYTQCGVDPIPTTGGGKKSKLIIGIGIGSGLGVALLLLVGWSLLARRRKPNTSQDVYPVPPPYNSSSTTALNSTTTTSSGADTSTPTTYQSQQSQSMISYSSSDVEKGGGGGGGHTTYFGVRVFSYTELERATNNFDEAKELGEGGFGTVYYGQLPDGQPIAVKRLYENSFRRVEQSFLNEIEILAKLRHDHLVTLYGCTTRHSRDLLLVYEYVANGTVADHLHGKRSSSGSFLAWSTRLSIATETAEALLYLHQSDIVHRDVKTPNILLDENFRVKVADFGLSRLFPNDVSHVSTAPQGTPGYVDPEYFQCYRLTEKSDVYSFGVVLAELVSSKQAVDITRHRHDINLSSMAMDRIKSGALNELVDEKLGFELDKEVERGVRVVCELAFRCLQSERDMRPSMEEVVEGLRGLRLRNESFKKVEGVEDVQGDLIDIGI